MTAHKRRHTTQPFALCKLSYHIEGLAQEFGLDRKDEEELAAFRAYYKERHPRKRGS